MSEQDRLQACIDDLVDDHRGILAADESHPTLAKRFAAIGVTADEASRREYRSLLLGTPDLGLYISGVILFEETLGQVDAAGRPLPALLRDQGIVPGIKVDRGLGELPGAPGERITFGLDGLAERLEGYRDQGARFAKWREVYTIGHGIPSRLGLDANAEMLARYAAQCQASGLVPIVEPEVLMDGDHGSARCAEVTEAVLASVFEALRRHRVTLELMLLKPNMVLPGKESAERLAPEQVATATLKVLRRTVPAAVPSINFLSGGMGPAEATANLNALNQVGGPWQLSLSYGRALQEPALKAWAGKAENGEACQQALLKRARLNSLARRGEYRPEEEA